MTEPYFETSVQSGTVADQRGGTVRIIQNTVCLHYTLVVFVSGAVFFGFDPAVITRRRSMLTYGVEVLHRFDPNRHPPAKAIRTGGQEWCTGVLDVFVKADQVVSANSQ